MRADSPSAFASMLSPSGIVASWPPAADGRASRVQRGQSRFVISVRALSAIALAGLLAVTVALLFSGHSQLLTYAFPVLAVAVGALLLITDPARYLALVLWLWMISPFVRRVVDERSGWNAQNPILLAPLLVCALAAADVFRFAPRMKRRTVAPLVVAMISLVGGVVVGLTLSPAPLVLYAGLSWVAPVLFGMHVAMHPERAEAYHRAILLALTLGLVVLGVYGIAQFVAPAIWDRLWMVNSRMNSIGTPEPLRVRVFSMMNAPGPLAQFLSASLLIVLAHRSWTKWPALGLGVLIFLLSLARSAWLGFAMGLVLLLIFAPRRTRVATLSVGVTALVLVVALSALRLPPTLESMRQTIELRVTSMGDLSMDDSFRARRYLVPAVLSDVADRPLGSGLGATLVGGARGNASSRLADQGLYLDNGVLEILLVLGWGGGLLFLASALSALWMAFRESRISRSGYGYLAGGVALMAQVAGGTVFSGVGGAMFWMAVAMAMNAHMLGSTPGNAPSAERSLEGLA